MPFARNCPPNIARVLLFYEAVVVFYLPLFSHRYAQTRDGNIIMPLVPRRLYTYIILMQFILHPFLLLCVILVSGVVVTAVVADQMRAISRELFFISLSIFFIIII